MSENVSISEFLKVWAGGLEVQLERLILQLNADYGDDELENRIAQIQSDAFEIVKICELIKEKQTLNTQMAAQQ